jgi:hypothetical protein
MRYKCWRSWPDVELHLICREEGFDSLPERIRKLGPWTGSRAGQIQDLKPHYRQLLDEQGFVLVVCKPSELSLERT